uniref:Uncharacterized protein n=1 Tax=Nicotiana tabacum TaxID=4097 RepID=A0A1S3YIW9_TOBAC|nr:PREDICTED: uncharacterized protein LOC107776587 [Nicotiana tabacum]
MTGPPFGPDDRPVGIIETTKDDTSTLWGEFDLVDNANSRSRAPIVVTGTARLSTRSVSSLVGKHQITSTVFDVAASHSSTPSASSPPSPPPATATSFPSSSTLQTTVATSSPSSAPDHEEEKVWEMIQTLSGECLLNNAMHNAAANFLAYESLQRLIREKKELTYERDKLLAKRDQTVLHLSELENRATKADILETCLQQSEQEDAILAATDREAASAKRVINLEVNLNSKCEALAAVVAKYAQLEEKYKKTIEHNRLYSLTVRELDVSLKSARSAGENLSAEINQLKEEFKRRADSLIVEKTYSMYSMRRKILEEAKTGIIDIDAKTVKAKELELATKNGLPAQSDALGSSDYGYEFSKTKEVLEGDDAEDQAGENVEQSAEPTPGNTYTSLPLDFRDAEA